MTLEADYRARHATVLMPLSASLAELIADHLSGEPRIDRISARPKSIEQFLKKAENLDGAGQRKYAEPLAQIQDQVGARVTVFYKADVARVREILLRYLRPVETKNLVPASEWEFGYFGWHSVCLFPQELIRCPGTQTCVVRNRSGLPTFTAISSSDWSPIAAERIAIARRIPLRARSDRLFIT